MSLEAPGVAEKRLEQRPVANRRSSALALDEQRWRRTTDDARRAVCVDGRRRRRRARRTGRVDWRRCSDDRLDDAADAEADDRRRRRSGCGSRTRQWAASLCGGVHQYYRVRRYFRVVCFEDVLVCLIEVLGGRLLDDHLLGKLLRERLRTRERLEKGFRWRTLDLQEQRRLRIWRCREEAQAMSA